MNFTAKDKQSKVNARANIKIQELDSKIFTIQSRDLWKGIINYHLYHLDIIKRGNNEEKINQIANYPELIKQSAQL